MGRRDEGGQSLDHLKPLGKGVTSSLDFALGALGTSGRFQRGRCGHRRLILEAGGRERKGQPDVAALVPLSCGCCGRGGKVR